MALPEWELWACALAIERQYGDDAPRHIAERISALAIAGDEAGVETWKAIANRYDQLSPDHGGTV
ncbi:DUF6961 family protein [Sphingomonas asaccharolytica]|uniref:DUF6961 family protein n=1 Tax=Sphingomonas asaccharolytica TaxID=40681 RepID=UPI00082A03E9|nr:hypothetical protein [Sphingomonas asaccharolytica]